MNINRKVIDVNIGERTFHMILDFESAIYYQENMNESIFNGIEKISKENDFIAFAYVIASVLRDENDNLMGIEFVKKLNLIDSINFFMSKMNELMDNSLPEAKDDNSEKKKK